jgi:hypothetical protein
VDPEVKKLLQENLELAKQNNRMLRAIRRNGWVSFFWNITIWAILFIAPLYFYEQYVAPLVAQFQAVVPGAKTATTTPSGPFGLPSFTELENLVKSFETKR